MNFVRYSKTIVLGLGLIIVGSSTALSQDAALVLSRHSDFSTHDREFLEGDVVYVRVSAPKIDPADLEVNELRVSGATDANGSTTFTWRLQLHNNLNGTYTAKLDSLGRGTWYLRAALADSKGAAFEGDATFKIGEPNTPPDIRAEGVITALGERSLVILDRRIFANADTKVFDESGHAIEFSSLRIGDRVVVHFTVSFTGELIAKRIDRRRSDEHEVALRGRIERIGDREFVVLNHLVVVDSATVIVDEYGQRIRFGQLAVGDLVELKGVLLASGAILAVAIHREDGHDDEVEFTGAILEIGDAHIVVLNRRVLVTNETEIIGKNGELIRFGDLRLGMVVHVVASIASTDVNQLVAKRIKVAEDSRIVVEGEIQEIGEAMLVVAGLPFRVVSDTEVVTSTGIRIRFSDLRVGYKVSVYATAINTSEQLVALRIVLHRPSVEIRTITGFVSRIGENQIVVNDRAISVVDRTEIFNEHGERIRFADLSVGMRVRVHAVELSTTNLQDNLILVAHRIQVLPDREKKIVGRIRDVSENHIVIASVNAAITAETKILDQNGEPIGAGDLEVGLLAGMHVVETVSGVVATTIRLLPRLEDEVGVAGVLEAVEDSAIVVLGQTFSVLPNTVARDVDGTMIPYTDLEVGRPVALRGELLAGGTLVALHVQELAHAVRGIKVLGPIESIGASTLEVIGIHFFVDGDTKIYDLSRTEIALGDMEVGQTVLVGAEGQSDGTRLAKSIQLLDVVVASGDLTLAADGSISVLGTRYEIASDALIISSNNVAVDGGGLTDGMFVEIRGSQIDEGVFTVTKVKVLSAQSVGVDGEDVPTQQGDLALHSNYPNPFSGTTTIEFEVAAVAAASPTTLDVYDLTGRRVRTLVDAALGEGVYTVTWDGRDDAGRLVGSGLYFYRARIGDTTAARTMMVVR